MDNTRRTLTWVADRGEQRKLNRQIKKLSEAPAKSQQELELKVRRRAQERLLAYHNRNKAKRAEKKAELAQLIDEQAKEVLNAERQMAESVRE